MCFVSVLPFIFLLNKRLNNNRIQAVENTVVDLMLRVYTLNVLVHNHGSMAVIIISAAEAELHVVKREKMQRHIALLFYYSRIMW